MVYTVRLCFVVLSILKNQCGMFHFSIFQHFILAAALCVGETRAESVQGIWGHYKNVPCVLYFGKNHVSVSLSSSPHLPPPFF